MDKGPWQQSSTPEVEYTDTVTGEQTCDIIVCPLPREGTASLTNDASRDEQ